MSAPAWLKPVVGMLTAIAVGIGAAVVAVRLSSVESTDAPLALVEAAVLEPVADDAPFPEPAVDDEPVAPEGADTTAASRVVEVPDPEMITADGVSPDEPPAASAELEAAIDTAGASTDPYFTLIDLLPEVPALFGDPCAIAPVTDGCPAGATGAVLGGEMPELAARIERGVCATATGTTMAIAVRTNVPADIAVTARSGSVVVERTTSTDADDAAAWDPTRTGRIFWHCVATEGWERGSTVDIEATVTDVLGRTLIVDRSLPVPVSAAAVRPDAQILGLSGNLIQVSVPFADRQTVGVGWVDADAATCSFPLSGASGGPGVTPLRPATISPIDEEYVADNNWLPQYDERSTSVFAVTPGRSYRVCVGWFDGGVGDITGRPQYRNEVVVHAPATSFPTVLLREVRLDADVPEGGLSIRGSVPFARCGGWNGDETALPAVVCDLPAVSTAFNASGYITITTEIETESGPAINHHVLDSSAVNCEGGCEARRETLQVPILSARPGLCGSDCADQQTLGWARLSVSWPETVGREWWQLGETTTGPITELDGELPNMEIATARWIVNPRYDPTTATQGARFPLTTDRPVTVVATLVGDCYRTPEPPVYRTDEFSQWRGASIEFPDLCMGSRYAARIELTDEDGDVSTYAFARGDTRFWPYSDVVTQRLQLDLPVRVTLTPPEGEHWALGSSTFSFGRDGRGTSLSTPGTDVTRCFSSTGGIVTYRVDSVFAGATNPLELRLQLRQGELTADGVGPDGFRDCRGLPGAEYERITMTAELTLDELRTGSVVTYTDPGTGIVVTLRPEPTLYR